MGIFSGLLGIGKAILGGLGGAKGIAGAVGGQLLGGALDRHNDARARRDEWNFYRERGATLPEIMGAGGVGTGSSTGSTVLGNQAAELTRIREAQNYDREQRELDRAVAMRGQDAGLAAAETSAGASIYSSNTQARTAAARLALERDQYENIALPQGLNDIATSTPDWKRQQLLAQMGVDNAIATAILGAKGIDIMDPDTLSNMSTSEFRDLIRDIYGYQSTVFRESAGAATVIQEGMEEGAKDAGGWFSGLGRIFSGDDAATIQGR